MRKVLCCLLIVLFSLSLFSVPLKASGYPDEELVLGVGESYEIAGKPKVTVASGSIASVKDGLIIGIAPGKTTGTYTGNDGVSHKFSIKVKKTGIKVTMLDIGQGDAFLIRVNGNSIVLDTGEKKYYEYLKKQLDYFGVTSIDTLVISHMDTDHMGSAQLLVQDYGVKTVLMPVTPGNSTEYNKLMNAIGREHVNIVYVHTGDTYGLGTGCKIDILGADMGEGTNDSSIIMKLTYYKNRFIFTGDASASVLNKVMESGTDIKADVLKIAHHGSDYTNPLLFLKNVGAKYALISVGRDNAYGHPNDNVIRRLNTLKYKVFRTDLKGTVTLKGNGKTLKCSNKQIIDWDAEDRLKVEHGSIIGNVNSKVYHNENCMSLPMEKNRVYFDSAEDAEAAGYRKCGMCVKE